MFQEYDDEGIKVSLPQGKETEQIAWQLDTTQSVINFMQTLGWFYNDKEGVFLPLGDPVVNEKGFFKIFQYCNAIVNKENALSRLEEDQIRSIALSNVDAITADLTFNRRDYGIKDFTTLRTLIEELKTFTVFHLMKSRRGFMLKTMQEVRHVTLSGTIEKEKSLMQRIPFLGKKVKGKEEEEYEMV